MKVCPPTPTLSYDNSLANVGICSFVILIIYWLVDTWGCYGGCVSIGSASLFYVLILCRIMDIAYCMAMTLTSSNVYLILSLKILHVASIFSIEGVCVVVLAHAVMIINGSTFHLLIILAIGGFFYIFSIIIVSFGILSSQYVDRMNCIVRLS